jgi:glutamate/tyrosine decarboxylase-like PLP-dependent enzyme
VTDTGESGSREQHRDNWEWPAEKIRRFGYRVVDVVANHLTHLPERPVFQRFARELADRYLEFGPAPESAETEDRILETFLSEIEPFPFGNGHPRFYGWVNSPPVVISIFAEMLAAAMNPSCAGGNHAAIYVERQVINWFKHLLGFPPKSMGLLVSGASMAALTGLAVARHAKCGFDVRAQGVQGAPTRLLFYGSGELHGCHQKAAELLGIGNQNVRTVENDLAWRMRADALDARISRGSRGGSQAVVRHRQRRNCEYGRYRSAGRDC